MQGETFVTNPKNDHPEAKAWGYIDKHDRAYEDGIWVGVEPCYSEEQGKARAAELEKADPSHEYSAEPFLEPPTWISRKTTTPER